jgi:hypothetical protein
MTSINNRCEHREQHSRARRVNVLDKNQIDERHLRTLKDPTLIHKSIIQYQFQEIFQPHWFGSIQWQPFISDYATAVGEARHLRIKLLCALMNTKPNKIPDPPERPRMIWFHEKAPVLINPQDRSNPKYKIAYHSHFHLGECPDPFNSWIKLDWLIHHKVAKNFYRLSTSKSKENQGFVLKPWIREHHANYNLKDYYRFKHQQDADLVLDFRNSDLQFSKN